MAIENFQCAGHSYRAHHGWAWRKSFQNKSSQKAGKRYCEIGFANAVLRKIATLLMFCKQNSQMVCCTFFRIQSLL